MTDSTPAWFPKVEELCDAANEHFEADAIPAAIEALSAALDLVPDPKEEWEAATWIYASLGDAHYLVDDYAASKEAMFNALNCPDGQDNPFVHFRLGQSCFENEDAELAKKHLTIAYMLAGEEIFEDDDPKYLGVVER